MARYSLAGFDAHIGRYGKEGNGWHRNVRGRLVVLPDRAIRGDEIRPVERGRGLMRLVTVSHQFLS